MKPMARYEPKYHNQLWLATTVKDSHLLPVLQMKHIKFTFAEPIVGIQYVHNEVFVGDFWQLCVASKEIAQRLRGMLMDLHVPIRKRARRSMTAYHEIHLGDDFYFAFVNDEIFVMRGHDDIYVEDELGNKVDNYETHPDWEINDVYPLCK